MEDKIGGVPVHCKLLQRVFPEAIHLTCSKVGVTKGTFEEMSYNLGYLAEHKGLIKPDDIVITDGFWGCGLSNQDRVIVVCHGILSGDVGLQHPISQYQKKHMERNHVVSVSINAAQECIRDYQFTCDTVIMNGIDLDIFCPPQVPPGAFVLGTIDPMGKCRITKFNGLIDRLKADFTIQNVQGDWPYAVAKEYQKCSAYLHLSRYEGCSYAVNEALATGLPIIATPTGLIGNYQAFLNEYKLPIGEILTSVTPTYEEVKASVLKVQREYSTYKPLEWCQKYCNFQLFKKEWTNYIANFISV